MHSLSHCTWSAGCLWRLVVSPPLADSFSTWALVWCFCKKKKRGGVPGPYQHTLRWSSHQEPVLLVGPIVTDLLNLFIFPCPFACKHSTTHVPSFSALMGKCVQVTTTAVHTSCWGKGMNVVRRLSAQAVGGLMSRGRSQNQDRTHRWMGGK